MGYGKKYDFTKVNEMRPEGGTYTINSEFDNNKKLKRGYVVGNSREVRIYLSRKSYLILTLTPQRPNIQG